MAITDHAGKLGIKVEVVSADHQNKPDIGSSIARGWYDIAAVQNVKIVTGFYWDRTGESRAFAMRFSALHPRKAQPNDMHAGMYAATLHLMKAYAPLKSAADGKALVDAMKQCRRMIRSMARDQSGWTGASCIRCICWRPRRWPSQKMTGTVLMSCGRWRWRMPGGRWRRVAALVRRGEA